MFHRLTVPSYAGGLRGGDDYLNNAVAGTPAPADTVLVAGLYAGSYFFVDGQVTAAAVNRGLQALAANCDFLDDAIVDLALDFAAFTADYIAADAVVTADYIAADVVVTNGYVAAVASEAATRAADDVTLLGAISTEAGARSTDDGIEAAARIAGDAALQLQFLQQSGLRLTLTSGSPVTDSTSGATLYLTPFVSGMIRLYYGGAWTVHTTAEVSVAISLALSSIYDVFAYWTGAAVALEFSAAWTNSTTRSQALTRQDGVLVKSADPTRLYVGTVRTNASFSTQLFDDRSTRYVWNYYNRQPRYLRCSDSTDSWTYANPNQVWRQVRASTTNKVEFVCGDVTPIEMTATSLVSQASAGPSYAGAGIGIDSTTVNSAPVFGNVCYTTPVLPSTALYRGLLAAGYHAVNWLEVGYDNAVTYTFLGDAGTAGLLQTGMIGSIQG
jgi:hypothetical protein